MASPPCGLGPLAWLIFAPVCYCPVCVCLFFVVPPQNQCLEKKSARWDIYFFLKIKKRRLAQRESVTILVTLVTALVFLVSIF